MEGRKPPPRASHPFPNNPDLSKFWGTPYAKGFFKSFGVYISLFAILNGINMYLTRHQKGPFGLDLSGSKEDFEKRMKMIGESGRLMFSHGLNLDYRYRENQFSTDPRMRFDDGVDFNMGTDEVPVKDPI